MAYITNIQLTVSVIGGGSVANKAEVKCTINFSNAEVAANQNYIVRAFLYEEDNSRDFFEMHPDGRMSRLSRGNKDDYVGYLPSIKCNPNGNSTVDITLSHEWTFQELDDIPPSMEKFFATVSVIPELAMGDWRFSPVVNIDVG
jgi:hypothetical protein